MHVEPAIGEHKVTGHVGVNYGDVAVIDGYSVHAPELGCRFEDDASGKQRGIIKVGAGQYLGLGACGRNLGRIGYVCAGGDDVAGNGVQSAACL